MLEETYDFLHKVDAKLSSGNLQDALRLTRPMGLGDFGELMLSMPNPQLPNLSRLLPKMASDEVQDSWTGRHGHDLLMQTGSFVRSAAYNYSTLTHNGLSGRQILDFGCGYGRIARLMYYFTDPENFVGVDPWDRSIQLCREAGFGDNFRQSDYLPNALPVDDRKFDLIYAFSVFTHLSEGATRTALTTLRRYVADDGVLLITIRPIEYWTIPGHQSEQTAHHRKNGFAFVGHNREAVEGEITYGDTSFSLDWLSREFPMWRVAGQDRSIDDPYQRYVFLRPG